jgi:hypothetical protein
MLLKYMTNARNEIRRPAFYHDTGRLYEHKMLHTSVNSKTIMTFSILVIALLLLRPYTWEPTLAAGARIDENEIDYNGDIYDK